MSSGGIPELGISAERSMELARISIIIFGSSLHLWDYILELEKHQDITEREKMAMIAALAHTTSRAQREHIIPTMKLVSLQGLS